MRPKKSVTLAKEMGKRIKYFRTKSEKPDHGLPDMAETIGVSIQTWYKWEKGDVLPSDSNQQKLAQLFGISMSELRGESGQPAYEAAGNTGRKTPPGLKPDYFAITTMLVDCQNALARIGQAVLAAQASGDNPEAAERCRLLLQESSEYLARLESLLPVRPRYRQDDPASTGLDT